MTFGRSFVLICVSVLAMTFVGSGVLFAAWGDKELEAEKVAVTFYKEVVRGGYKIVTTEELKGWVDQKKDMLVIDTMPFETSFKKQHIPGAINFELPIPEMTSMDDKTKAAFLKALGPNKDRVLVFYCGFTKCTRSHNGAMWAIKLGYKNVYRQPGGIKGWDEAGYTVEAAK
jgi:thiosulfate/3-mercaptopyruvate sulfurtransferase